MVSEESKDEYSWESFPARQRVRTTILLVLFLLLFFTGVYFSFKSIIILTLSIAILTVSLWSYFTPRWYKLNESGVEIRTLFFRREKPWDYFHSYYWDKGGVQLSTFSYPSRLDTFRGLSLMFGSNNQDEVIEFVGRYLDKAERKKKRKRS